MATDRKAQGGEENTKSVFWEHLLIWAALLACFLTMLYAIPAKAGMCVDRAIGDVVADLHNGHQESPLVELQALGMERVFIVTAQAGGGSWTLLSTDERGWTCVGASGEYWRAARPVPPIEEAP